MARILLDRPSDPTIDVQPDGGPWPFVLVIADERCREITVLADTCADVLGQLIEGYDDIPNTPHGMGQAFARREAMAFRIAGMVQVMLIDEAIQDGTLRFEQTPDDIAYALLTDRSLPTVGIDEWSHPVPLVLVSTLYQPFGTTGRPGGNVVWVEPHDERGFLDNLADLGVAKFRTVAIA